MVGPIQLRFSSPALGALGAHVGPRCPGLGPGRAGPALVFSTYPVYFEYTFIYLHVFLYMLVHASYILFFFGIFSVYLFLLDAGF